MKRILLAFIFLGALYLAGFSFGKAHFLSSSVSEILMPLEIDHGFRTLDYPLEYRPFTLVAIGRNNGAFVEKTLRSMCSQVYPSYRIIYIDDGSTDGSAFLVKDLMASHSFREKVTLICNEEPLGELANLCQVLETCEDREIVVWIGGSDWLAHEWVLSRLNSYYADPDLWMTYGQYREFPGYRLGQCAPFDRREVEERGFRGAPFAASHLRTFYAGLFKRISKADLMNQGEFLSTAIDAAVMTPLLEMAEGHFQYISEILYIANRQVKIEEDPEALSCAEHYIRSLASYPPLESAVTSEVISE